MEDDSATSDIVVAVKEGDLAKVEGALSSGSQPDVIIPAPSRDVTWCLLSLAASRGHTEIVKALLNIGLSVEGSGTDDRTPLMLAARHGHSGTVKTLLNSGAESCAQDKYGHTAMHAAAQKGHLECVSLFNEVTPITSVNNEGASPVHSASFGGHVEVIDKLKGANWSMKVKDKYGRTALHWAAEQGKLEAVKYLVEKVHLDPLEKCNAGLTSLDYAVMFGRHALERWLLQHIGEVHRDIERTLHLMKLKMKYDENCHQDLILKISEGGADLESYRHHDLNMSGSDGKTPLQIAAWLGIPTAVRSLLNFGAHPHVVTLHGHTASDIAREERSLEVLNILEEHKCPQSDQSPEMLYKEMLKVIFAEDNVRKVSNLMCAGCPVQPVGETIQSALHLAVDNDRPRILSLLLAAGATLTYSINNFNLLQQAWNSSNATSAVLCSLTRAYSSRLRAERDRLESSSEICLEIDTILQTLAGNTPWAAAWSKGESVHLTELMAEAVQANCLTTAALLQQAGAWCFFSGSKPSPLHAALEAKHWSLAKTLVRDLKGCIYIPDRESRFPRDMMPRECQQELEQVTYQQERQKLRVLADQQKDEDKKEEVETVLRLQEQLFFGLPVQADYRHFIVVVRNGLLHITHMLLQAGYLKVDDVLDSTNGSTALHEAASHGKTACTALLMTAGADPLQHDRYGHTPLLLAAMFGHRETFHLMAQRVGEHSDCPCRAGTTAQQTRQNYKAYLQCYRKCGDEAQGFLTILDHREEKQIIKAILKIISNKDLLQEAERANVDFSKGEAKQVKNVVVQEISKIIQSVGMKHPVYKGSLSLVGSSDDGFKLYAPDEFDFNLVISLPKANITLEHNSEREKDLTEPQLLVKLESTDDALQGNRFMSGLYEAVKEHFDGHLLEDPRLSIVPPGLNKTKIGVALPMAWQGAEYPLLLVSVDLVPVLDVPWHDKVTRPPLTPPETTNMQISNANDGSWRCSFAKVETCVMRDLQLEERQVYLASKTLLSCLKVEPWMPHELKAFCTWWCARQWKIPAPKGFCLKNCFLMLLESKRRNASKWSSTDLMKHVRAVFKSMCSETFAPKLTYAYFGGDCEGPTRSIGAETIIDCFPGE